jgi:predicted nucleic acid-binding protein
MPVPDPWVMDTSVFTHWHRAGHGEILRRVAPDGEVILIPDAVNAEVEIARERYSGIPAIAECEWATLVVLGSDEGAVQLAIQADMGADTAFEHAGEAAVIAYAQAHGCMAILDEREAISQAEEHDVECRDSMWIAIEALHVLDDIDRARAEQIVDDLLATGMWLPVKSGASLVAWAYRVGYMPHGE